jgi:hypothetical protein
MLGQVRGVVERSFPDVVATGWKRIDEEGEEDRGWFFLSLEYSRDAFGAFRRIVQFLKGLFPLWIGAFLVKRSLSKRR